jgi:hypothetical protein
MSEPYSDKARSSMDVAFHSSRPAMPSIEDIEEDVDVKSEIKAEATGHESPLFEPHSYKRNIQDEKSASDSKRLKAFTMTGPQAYGGGPVRQYVPGAAYKYSRHEEVPYLEINGRHHQDAVEHFRFNIREVVLPALLPYRDEDKSVSDSVEWFEKNANVPAIPPTRFAFIGNSGSGKTSTLNNVLGQSGLANADAAMEGVTQNPQIFNHGTQDAMFSVEVLFLNGRAIESLIKRCVTDLVKYSKSISGSGDGEENDYIQDSAESSRQVIDDLFSHQEGLKSLDDVDEFLEPRNLLPEGDEPPSETAIQSLCQQVSERASSEDIDLNSRELRFTAGNLGELHAKTMRFSERGAFAPLVSSIRTKLYSPLLLMGIEIADLPGYTDTNTHLRKTSMAYSANCPKAIFVADLSRCLTTPDLKKSLKDVIKHKGAENVCLVLRGKENVEKSKSKWTKDESAHLETLEKSLKAAKSQLDPDDESIEATAAVKKIERQILEYRISVRDRVITDHFSQKEYQNKHDTSKIRVITVANKCHEQYMLGTKKAILSIDKTGIKNLRAYMCDTPSRDRVRAFARHSANTINKIRRICIWADGPKMPPRDAAMALFEDHARWAVENYITLLSKAVTQYKRLMVTRLSSKWANDAQTAIDGWAVYAARTQGVFFRQGGRHSPQIKGARTKKPKLVSWIEPLLKVAEDDVSSLLKSMWDVLQEVEGNIGENIVDVVEKIRHGLEMLDTIGGANLEGVFEIFAEESRTCVRDMKEGMVELRTNLRYVLRVRAKLLEVRVTNMSRTTVMNSVVDEPQDDDSPIFVKEMFRIFTATFKKLPPGTKNVTKERIKSVREQVINDKGPYNKMINEIAAKMGPVIDEWASKTNSRINRMHDNLRDVLFKSFEGKKMPDARRKQIAPAIKDALLRAKAVLQADLEGYAADIF